MTGMNYESARDSWRLGVERAERFGPLWAVHEAMSIVTDMGCSPETRWYINGLLSKVSQEVDKYEYICEAWDFVNGEGGW